MKAPGSVYSACECRLTLYGDTAQSKHVMLRLPLALSSYKSTSSETSTQTDANFCDMFFCDAVKHYKYYDNTNSRWVECVYGLLVETPGQSAYLEQRNHYLHTLTGSASTDPYNRKGMMRINEGGRNYILLNDGGLNTLPWVELATYTDHGTSYRGMVTPRYSYFYINYRNAYYTPTTELLLGIEYGVTTQGGSTIAYQSTVPQYWKFDRNVSVKEQISLVKGAHGEVVPITAYELSPNIYYDATRGANQMWVRITPKISNSENDNSVQNTYADLWPYTFQVEKSVEPLTLTNQTTGVQYCTLITSDMMLTPGREEEGFPTLGNLLATSTGQLVIASPKNYYVGYFSDGTHYWPDSWDYPRPTTTVLRGRVYNWEGQTIALPTDPVIPAGAYSGFDYTPPSNPDPSNPDENTSIAVTMWIGKSENDSGAHTGWEGRPIQWKQIVSSGPTPPPYVGGSFSDITALEIGSDGMTTSWARFNTSTKSMEYQIFPVMTIEDAQNDIQITVVLKLYRFTTTTSQSTESLGYINNEEVISMNCGETAGTYYYPDSNNLASLQSSVSLASDMIEQDISIADAPDRYGVSLEITRTNPAASSLTVSESDIVRFSSLIPQEH